MKKEIIIGALLLIIGAVAGALLCRTFHHPSEVGVVQTDTLVYRDTIREYYPVEISREVVDTMLITLRDTIRIHDTLFVSLPLEKKVYASDEYYAEISGHRPNLDYIEVFPKTKVVTKTIAPAMSRNTLSIGIEPSYLNGPSIPIYLEYGRRLHKNVEIYGQFVYDVHSRQFGMGIGLEASIGW